LIAVLVAILVAISAGCASPAAARPLRVPISVLSSLAAAEQGDVEGFLAGFSLEESARDRESHEALYRSWLADLTDLEWEVAQVQPRLSGGLVVVAEIRGWVGDVEERFSLIYATNPTGEIVGWTVAKDPPGPDS
jgi:hypothetical protein